MSIEQKGLQRKMEWHNIYTLKERKCSFVGHPSLFLLLSLSLFLSIFISVLYLYITSVGKTLLIVHFVMQISRGVPKRYNVEATNVAAAVERL